MKACSGVLFLAVCLWLVVHAAQAKPNSSNRNSASTSGAGKKQESASGTSATACTCGQAKKGRIIGGKTTTNHYPWAAMLVISDTLKQFCGAVVVTEKVAFTAAHCSVAAKGVKISLVAGTSDSQEPKRGQIVGVEKTIEPDEFFSPEKEFKQTVNDISLLLLAVPLKFDSNVGPVCLPTGKKSYDDKWLKIVGWGKTNPSDQDNSRYLKEIEVQAMTFTFCKSKVGLKEPQKQICTMSSGKGTCWGDTGSPVVYLDPETKSYTLAGIVSFMDMECKTDEPTVSTELSAYLPWIKTKINTLGCQNDEENKTKIKNGDSTRKGETIKGKKAEKSENKDGKKETKNGTEGKKAEVKDQKKGSASTKKTASAQKNKGANEKKSGSNRNQTGTKKKTSKNE